MVRDSSLQPTELPDDRSYIETWDKLIETYHSNFRERTPELRWIVRGQRSADWGLRPYLERLIERYDVKPHATPHAIEARLARVSTKGALIRSSTP